MALFTGEKAASEHVRDGRDPIAEKNTIPTREIQSAGKGRGVTRENILETAVTLEHPNMSRALGQVKELQVAGALSLNNSKGVLGWQSAMAVPSVFEGGQKALSPDATPSAAVNLSENEKEKTEVAPKPDNNFEAERAELISTMRSMARADKGEFGGIDRMIFSHAKEGVDPYQQVAALKADMALLMRVHEHQPIARNPHEGLIGPSAIPHDLTAPHEMHKKHMQQTAIV